MKKARKPLPAYWRFWLTSSRGTDQSEVVYLGHHGLVSREDVEAFLEDWCSQFGAWQVSESFCRYGFRAARPNEIKAAQRRERRDLAGMLSRAHADAGRLGLLKTMRKIHAAVQAVGFEIEEVES